MPVPPEVADILAWNPQFLEPPTIDPWKPRDSGRRTGVSNSTTTGKPRDYDKNLAENMILKRVVLLDDLPRQLCAVTSEAIDAFTDHLPTWTGKSTKIARQDEDDQAEKGLYDEASVVDAYVKIFSEKCIRVASTLSLLPRGNSWHQFFKIVSRSDACAIPDCVLEMIPTAPRATPKHKSTNGPDQAYRYDAIEPAYYQTLVKQIHRELGPLVIFEMKSATVGNSNKMYGVRALAQTNRDFPWTTDSPDSDSDERLGNSERGTSVKSTDDDDTPEAFVDSIHSIKNLFQSHELPPLPSANRRASRARNASRRVATPEPEVLSQGTEEYLAPAEKANKKRDKKDPDFKEKAESPARILQQAWAEAVRVDATFLVIYSGNYEFIGYRHRQTQRLYLSPCLEYAEHPDPQAPAGKVHVGLYIAALRDAMARLRRRQENLGNNVDELGGKFSFASLAAALTPLAEGNSGRRASQDLDGERGRKRARMLDASDIRCIFGKLPPSIATCIDSGIDPQLAGIGLGTLSRTLSSTASNSGASAIISDTPYTAVPSTSATVIPTNRPITGSSPAGSLPTIKVYVGSRVVDGKLGEAIYSGTLVVSGPVEESVNVLVKVAKTEDDKTALKKEEEFYVKYLDVVRGLPECIGLFREDPPEAKERGDGTTETGGGNKEGRATLDLLVLSRTGLIVPNRASAGETSMEQKAQAKQVGISHSNFSGLRERTGPTGIQELLAANLVSGGALAPMVSLLHGFCGLSPYNTKHAWGEPSTTRPLPKVKEVS